MRGTTSNHTPEKLEDVLTDFGKAFVRAWKAREREQEAAIKAGDMVDVVEPITDEEPSLTSSK